jgi:3-hydroxybutyryl-CoA dehydratase
MLSMTYDDFQIGVKLAGAVTIGEAHIVMSSGLFNDFNPMHMNEEVARRSVLGKRILHAPTTIGIMLGIIGNAVAETGIADLETSFRFRHPVGIGDTISYEWEVTGRDDKPKYQGGIITYLGTCTNQDGDLVVEAMNKLLIANVRAGEQAAARS